MHLVKHVRHGYDDENQAENGLTRAFLVGCLFEAVQGLVAGSEFSALRDLGLLDWHLAGGGLYFALVVDRVVGVEFREMLGGCHR